MPGITKPIWVWLEGATRPVQAGVFTLDPQAKVGQFQYDSAYVQAQESFALDPWLLPIEQRGSSLRTPRLFRNTLHEGVFGVFLDACPEGFGADVLNHKYGAGGAGLSKPDLLEKSVGDGVGAVEVCEDIDRKLAASAPPVEALIQEVGALEAERSASVAVTRLVADGTSMGGERPKMTVAHQGEMWLAKLQDRRDQPYMPAREDLAMTLARECGIDAAYTELVRTDNDKALLLVRRFDREGVDGGRHAYLSANTLLRLDSHSIPGDRARSYLSLADSLVYLKVPPVQVAELWRRMVFNALVNNYDDHPRNHGVVRIGAQWQLAPAFDITPLFHRIDVPPLLAMSVSRDGSSVASTDGLLRSAPHFGLQVETAAAWLSDAATIVAERWLPYALSRGMSESFCTDKQAGGFAYATDLAAHRDRIFDTATMIARENAGRRRAPRKRK